MVSDSDSDGEGTGDNEQSLLQKLAKALTTPTKVKPKKKLTLPRYATPGLKKTDDKLGPDVQEGAPELLDTLFRSIYPCKKVKETLDEVLCPGNCESLKPVMINKEIYSRMNKKQCKKDEPMKFITNGVVKASQPVAAVWNQLLDLENKLRTA